MIFFSITFTDHSRVTGKATKVTCNGIDVTNKEKREMMNCFVDNSNIITIQTNEFEIKFLVGNVLGFSI